jgi:hypothetical protein
MIAIVLLVFVFPKIQLITGYILGTVCILFFASSAFISLFRLLSNKPALIINDVGICDYSSMFSNGDLNWNEIDDLFINSISNHIEFVLSDTKLKNMSKINKLLLRRQQIVSISSQFISMSNNELYEVLVDRWKLNHAEVDKC